MFQSLRHAKKNALAIEQFAAEVATLQDEVNQKDAENLRLARAIEQYAAEVAALQGEVNQKNAEIKAATKKADRLAAKNAKNLRLALAIPNGDILDLRRRYTEVIERNDRLAALLTDLTARLDNAVLALRPGPPSSTATGKDGG